jgi:hypothetical protein
MSPFEELLSLADQQIARAGNFYRLASEFPHKLLAALEKYLEVPAGEMKLVTPDPNQKFWEWGNWPGEMNSANLDTENFFRIGIFIKLERRSALIKESTIVIVPTFGFRPVHNGISVHMMIRRPDGYYDRKEEILTVADDSSFKSLFDYVFDKCRGFLNYDPLTDDRASEPIGFALRT